MAPFTVRIESDLPVLLSNGNPVDRIGDGRMGRMARPLAQARLSLRAGRGRSGGHPGQLHHRVGPRGGPQHLGPPGRRGQMRLRHGRAETLDAWDEEVYGREYDLDIFNIVAVDDFNMGAMENKGLNIFNSKYVLASPETATDRDYEHRGHHRA
jgi:aminopeptidase N